MSHCLQLSTKIRTLFLRSHGKKSHLSVQHKHNQPKQRKRISNKNTNTKTKAEAKILAGLSWFSGSSRGSNHSICSFSFQKSPSQTLQFHSFEIAKTMFHLVCLYKFLSDHEFSNLLNGPLKSRGIMYLNSSDERFLLNLACKEKLEVLDSATITVARLGKKCSNFGLKHFHQVFDHLKQGMIDIGKTEYQSACAEKIIEKMEKYVAATSSLHSALEYLNELELSEQKLQIWKKNISPKLPQKTNYSYFKEKLVFQRKLVKHYREISLWSKTFDKGVGLMARIICIIYIRICDLFSSFVPNLPVLQRNVSTSKEQYMTIHQQLFHRLFPGKRRYLAPKRKQQKKIQLEMDYGLLAEKHEYIERHSFKSDCSIKSSTQFYSQELSSTNLGKKEISDEVEKTQQVIQSAPAPSTVGEAGLALRYANIIIHAERFVLVPMETNKVRRELLYETLPQSLKTMVKGKLWSRRKRDKDGSEKQAGVEEWRDLLYKKLGWLAPMAYDTVKWHKERHLEKQGHDVKPTVLQLQTLHFSDLEKAEAAIVDVLVGLNCVYGNDSGRLRGGDRSQGRIQAIIPTAAKIARVSFLERTKVEFSRGLLE